MELYYKSSEGTVLNLIGDEYKMLSETDLFNTEWQYEIVGSNYPYISAFKNQMVSKSCTVVVSGTTNDDLKDNLEHLIEVLDRDVRLNQVGAIYYGNYYRKCICTATEKGKVEGKTKTNVTLTFVAENGDWQSEQLSTYSGLSGGKYLNNYCVPSISSSEISYGSNSEITGSLQTNAEARVYLDVGTAQTVTIESATESFKYSILNSSDWVTVEPTDCPIDIDVSSKILNTQISFGVVSNTSVLEYTMTPLENSSSINWTPTNADTTPTIIFDLGEITTLSSISGINIGRAYGSSASTVSLEISDDGETYTTVESESVPSSYTSVVELSHTWSSSRPSARYIRVSGTNYLIRTKTFIIEAFYTGEEQNLATSSTVSYAPSSVQTFTIDEFGNVQFMRKYTNLMAQTGAVFTLPNTATIVAVNNLVIKNNESTARTFKLLDENHNDLDTVEVSANSTLNYSWSGEVETSQLEFLFITNNGEITSSNLEFLEEQEEAPRRYVLNENYVPSDVIITIYGATSSPSIMIGENQYGAENITLLADEMLEINTRDETIKHYVDSDGWVNVFYHRLNDTFEKIENGSSEITWDGNLKVDIELLNARSDPKWN